MKETAVGFKTHSVEPGGLQEVHITSPLPLRIARLIVQDWCSDSFELVSFRVGRSFRPIEKPIPATALGPHALPGFFSIIVEAGTPIVVTFKHTGNAPAVLEGALLIKGMDEPAPPGFALPGSPGAEGSCG